MMEHLHQAQSQISEATHTVVHAWTGKLLIISSVLGALKFAVIDQLAGLTYTVLGCLSLLMIMVINYPKFIVRMKDIKRKLNAWFKDIKKKFYDKRRTSKDRSCK